MTTSRKPIYYDPLTGEFTQFNNATDSLQVIMGTDVILGETVVAKDLLYIKPADSKAYKAKADADATRNVVLWALEGGILDDVIQVALPSNEVPDAALSPGVKYWLSSATGGAKTATIPTANWVVEAGTSSSATTFLFNPRTRVKLS